MEKKYIRDYETAKREAQERCIMCGGYDLAALGITSQNAYWYKDGSRLTPEEVAEVKAAVPVDEDEIRRLMLEA